MKSQKQKFDDLRRELDNGVQFSLDLVMTDKALMTHFALPPELHGPPLKDLPEREGQLTMAFITITKQMEVLAGKYNLDYLGFYNGEILVDRPAKKQLQPN